MRKFYFFLVASTIFISFASNLSTPDLSNVISYNKHTNNAELLIVDSSYSLAIIQYDSAEIYHPLLSHDRYNKAVCEALLGRFSDCETELRYLLEKGLDLSFIQDNNAFRNFLSSKDGYRFLNKKIRYKYNIYLRSVYDSLFNQDQFLRLSKPYGDEIRKIDSSNTEKMNKLIEEFGWPSEALIGNLNFEEKPYIAIINHQRNPKTRVYDYKESLYKAYGNGYLEEHEAANLISLFEMTDRYKINDAGIVTILLDSVGTYNNKNIEDYLHVTGFVKFLDDRLKLYNQNRITFGLESIENFRKKLMYFKDDKRFRISQKGWFSTYVFSSIEDYNYAIKSIDKIE